MSHEEVRWQGLVFPAGTGTTLSSEVVGVPLCYCTLQPRSATLKNSAELWLSLAPGQRINSDFPLDCSVKYLPDRLGIKFAILFRVIRIHYSFFLSTWNCVIHPLQLHVRRSRSDFRDIVKHFHILCLDNEQKAGAVCTDPSCCPECVWPGYPVLANCIWLPPFSFVPPSVTWTGPETVPRRIIFPNLY